MTNYTTSLQSAALIGCRLAANGKIELVSICLRRLAERHYGTCIALQSFLAATENACIALQYGLLRFVTLHCVALPIAGNRALSWYSTIAIILLATLKISMSVAICQCGPALKITFMDKNSCNCAYIPLHLPLMVDFLNIRRDSLFDSYLNFASLLALC